MHRGHRGSHGTCISSRKGGRQPGVHSHHEIQCLIDVVKSLAKNVLHLSSNFPTLSVISECSFLGGLFTLRHDVAGKQQPSACCKCGQGTGMLAAPCVMWYFYSLQVGRLITSTELILSYWANFSPGCAGSHVPIHWLARTSSRREQWNGQAAPSNTVRTPTINHDAMRRAARDGKKKIIHSKISTSDRRREISEEIGREKDVSN